MTAEIKAELEAELAAAEADVARIRAENQKLAEGFRAEASHDGAASGPKPRAPASPSGDSREVLKRAAASLAAARDRADAARATLTVFERTGSRHGLLAAEGKVTGTVAVLVKAGATREERQDAIAAELSDRLAEAAAELGVVLAAAPGNFTRERPGRDPEGRTVLEVAGRVEGDRLVPAVSRAAKHMRT